MSDDDNYTIDEPDDLPTEESVEALSERSSRHLIPLAVLVLGLLVILAAAWCQSGRGALFNGEPDRSSLFVVGLAQPLGIVGALLTVVGVCAIGLRLQGSVALDRIERNATVDATEPVGTAPER